MRTKKLFKQIVALFLAFVISITSLPLSVLATFVDATNEQNHHQTTKLLASGSGLITGSGTGFANAVQLANLQTETVTAIAFNATSFIETQTQNQRFISYFATLSNGDVVAFRARSLGATGHTGFDQLNFGIGGTLANVAGGSTADSTAFSPNSFSTYNTAFTPAATAETANDYTITLQISEAVATGALIINETPIASLNFTTPVPAGTTITGMYAFSHSSTITLSHDWSLYNLSPAEPGENPDEEIIPDPNPEPTIPVEIPLLTVATGAAGAATLNWNAVEFADRYFVYHRQYPDGNFTEPTVLGDVLTYTFSGLTNDQHYEFAVRAGNDLGMAIDEHRATEQALVHVATVELEATPWFEAIGVTWTARPIDTGFNLYVSPAGEADWTLVNNPNVPVVGQSTWVNDHRLLVRETAPLVWSGDILGLPGEMAYDVKLVAHHDGLTLVTQALTPATFDRQGFAFAPTSPFGEATGAYNADGSLRDDAVVIYITAENVNTFTTPWATTGIGGVDGLFHENHVRNRNGANAGAMIDATPVAIRFVGNVPTPTTVRTGNMIRVARSANFTFEGVGTDALINGWGLNVMSSNVVIRNLTFIGYPDDAINLEGWGNANGQWPTAATGLLSPAANTGNRISTNIWVVQNTFKDTNNGDGAVDASNNSSYFTIGGNRVYDGGRLANLGSTQNNMRFRGSLHNNYISNNESRVPRVRWGQVHFYNNVINGANIYAVGAGHHANIIAEGNYFARANRPMIISNQGSALNNGSNTLTGDFPGYLITTLTTSENHPENPNGNSEIFALATELEDNIFGEITTFDPTTDQGLPTATNNRQAEPFQFFNPHNLNMNVSVKTALEAKTTVPRLAGAMQNLAQPAPPNATIREGIVGNPSNANWTIGANNEINFSMENVAGGLGGGNANDNFHTYYLPVVTTGFSEIFVETTLRSKEAFSTNNNRHVAGIMFRAQNATATHFETPYFGELMARWNGNQHQFTRTTTNGAGNARGAAQITTNVDWTEAEHTLRLTYVPSSGSNFRYSIIDTNNNQLNASYQTTQGNPPRETADFSVAYVGIMAHAIEATFTDFRIVGIRDGIEEVIFDIHTASGESLPQPDNLVATTGISGEVTLAWDLLPGATSYELAYRLANDNSAPLAWQNVGNATSYTLADLTDNTPYTFYVRGTNANGPGNSATITTTPTNAATEIALQAGAWFETVYASFTAPVDAHVVAHVRQTGSTWEAVDNELIRVVDESRNTWRIDVPGRLAGDANSHDLRIRILENQAVVAQGIATNLQVMAFDRQGAAFVGGVTTGGYHADGTVPENATIIYVTPENAFEVLSETAFPATGGSNVNRPNTPTIIRIMGQIGEVAFVGDTSGIPPAARANYFLNIRGRENVTIEGIGPDAMLYGFGIQLQNSHNIEVRNLSFDMFFDDAIGVHGNNQGATSTHYWLHHNRIFYGQDRYTHLGHDDDLRFGDGGIDVTNHARNFTISHNQFFGTDKSMLLGNAVGDTIAYGTVHHNWFYGSSQRLPRVRNAQIHVFNNLYEFATSYGIGAGHRSSIIAEGNTFNNVNRPYIISGQGSAGTGTLSTDYPGAIMVASNDTGIFGRALVADYLDENSLQTFNPLADIGLDNDNIRGSHRFVEANFPYAPSAIGVQSATDAKARVRQLAGPIANLTPSEAPNAPIITSLKINPEILTGLENQHIIADEASFTIAWQGDLITSDFTIEWDQGTGNWEPVATIARTGRPLSLTTTAQHASLGATYNFRIVAINAAGVAISTPASVTYEMPTAPTDFAATNVLGGLTIAFTEPNPLGANYEIRLYLLEATPQNSKATTAPIILQTQTAPLTALDLVPGRYLIEVRTQVGSYFSQPLVGTGEVLPWRIPIADLTTPVWDADFTTWQNGAVRGADATALGISILNSTGGPAMRNQNFPEGVVENRNDVLVDEFGLRLLDASAPGVGEAVRPYGTMMFIDIGEEITNGRVLVEIELNYIRSADGNSMRPLRLWDRENRPIIDFRVDQLPTVPTGPSGQNATAEQINAGIVTPPSEVQHWQIALCFETRRFDMFLNGAAFLFDQPIPEAVTGLQWIGAVTPTGNQSGHNWAELSVNYQRISVFSENQEPTTPPPADVLVEAVEIIQNFLSENTSTNPLAISADAVNQAQIVGQLNQQLNQLIELDGVRVILARQINTRTTAGYLTNITIRLASDSATYSFNDETLYFSRE